MPAISNTTTNCREVFDELQGLGLADSPVVENLREVLIMSHWRRLLSFSIAALAVSLGARALAGDDHNGHGAHVHGIATLNVAVDGNQLLIELDSPAMNIVGFEHAPRTEEQREAVGQAKELLADAERLFLPSPAAQCTLAQADVLLDLGEPESGAGGAADGAHDHGDEHEHEHKHDNEHEHEHEHDAHHGSDGAVHADGHGDYAFDCARPERLTELDVRVFARLPGIEQLQVQVITAQGQYGAELTPDNHLLEL
jgi:hypothetical protein